jgi:phosphate transport system protein
MRDRYLRQLKLVHDDLLRMGSRVEHALADAMRSLETWDTSLARRVISGDREIDETRTSIEEAVLELLATQQPVLATDLRTLNATIAIAGELERAGDYAKAVAKRVERCLRAPALLETPAGLHRMGTLAQAMLHTCLDAFVRLDVGLARSLAAEDERVDKLEDQVVGELMAAARQEAGKLDCAIYLLDVAHTLERLADRTTNIAERVIFIATNVTEELNA